MGVQTLSLDIDKATKIFRIQKIDSLIFVFATSGLCVVFDRVSNAKLGVLNQGNDEMIFMLHFNDLDRCVLILSNKLRSKYGRCHRVPLELMKRGSFQQRVTVFGSLSLPHDVRCRNGRAFYQNAKGTYDIFDLNDYSLLFSIRNLHYVEYLLPLPGMIIIFRQVVRDVTTFTVHNILDGAEIKKFMLPSDEVIQPCIIKEQLLYNDQSGNSNLFDMKTSKVKRLKSDKLKRAQFRCLPSNNLLLSWEHGTYSIWELDTKKDTDELQLLCQGLYTGYSSMLFIHHDSVVISYYRPKDGSATGSISIMHIWTGHLMAKITGDIPGPESNKFLQILDISTMYYDEEKEELYTGTVDGGFQIWSS